MYYRSDNANYFLKTVDPSQKDKKKLYPDTDLSGQNINEELSQQSHLPTNNSNYQKSHIAKLTIILPQIKLFKHTCVKKDEQTIS